MIFEVLGIIINHHHKTLMYAVPVFCDGFLRFKSVM
jgi:hypothetical protein